MNKTIRKITNDFTCEYGLEQSKYIKPFTPLRIYIPFRGINEKICNSYFKVYSKSIVNLLDKNNEKMIDDYNNTKKEEKEILHKIIETEWKERFNTK